MQEVKVLRWCDNHLLSEGVRVPAQPVPSRLMVDGVEAEVDLCDGCDALLVPLREILRSIGSRAQAARGNERQGPPKAPQPTERPSLPEPKVQCALCESWMRPNSRANHAKIIHGLGGASEIEWFFEESVTEVWGCECGLNFPKKTGRDRHQRHKTNERCGTPDDDRPHQPRRPA